MTFGKPDCFDEVGREVAAAHEEAALFDQSTFGKIEVKGADACAFLNRVCANNMDRKPGRAIYTAMLNERGGMESDLTAIRIAGDHYRLFVGTAAIRRDMAWLRRHLGEANVELRDSTEDFAVIGLMGPKAAAIAKAVGANELNDLSYFGVGEAHIAGAHVRAVRLSYVGEAGWEITCKAENAGRVHDALAAEGARPAGLFAQTSMRIEKRFLAYGHELDTDISPLQAGLGFAVDWDGGFIGRDALLKQREKGAESRIVTLILDDGDAVPLGNEPVLCDGEIVGKTTSAAFGYRVGKPIAIADVTVADARSEGTHVEIDIAGDRFGARLRHAAAFDTAGARMRPPK